MDNDKTELQANDLKHSITDVVRNSLQKSKSTRGQLVRVDNDLKGRAKLDKEAGNAACTATLKLAVPRTVSGTSTHGHGVLQGDAGKASMFDRGEK